MSSQVTALSYHERKFARVVVHAAAVHQGSHVEDVFGVQDLLRGDRTDAAVGDGRRDDAGALARQLERAELNLNKGVV